MNKLNNCHAWWKRGFGGTLLTELDIIVTCFCMKFLSIQQLFMYDKKWVQTNINFDLLYSSHFDHLLMIMCSDQGKFKRIPVFRDPKGGYGFAPPYEFDSLVTLVLYYATNTMDKHNPDLETVLRFPAFTSSL